MNQLARSPAQIGKIIQRERRVRQLTQSKLADLAGLRQELISKIESGGPGTRMDSIFDLLAALDLEMVLTPRSKGSATDIEDIF